LLSMAGCGRSKLIMVVLFCSEISFISKYYKFENFFRTRLLVDVLVRLQRMQFAWPPRHRGKKRSKKGLQYFPVCQVFNVRQTLLSRLNESQ